MTSSAKKLQTLSNVAVILVAGFVMLRPSGPLQQTYRQWREDRRISNLIQAQWERADRLAASKGASGPHDVIEFVDYECPFCRRMHDELRQIEATGANISVGYIHFPLSIHPNAEEAAIAGICAEYLGIFPAFHSSLFQQDDLSEIDYVQLATEIAPTTGEKFQTCLGSVDARERLRAHRALAEDLMVRGTPTFLFQDGMVFGFVERDELLERISGR